MFDVAEELPGLKQINDAFKLPNYSFQDNEGHRLLCGKQSMLCK